MANAFQSTVKDDSKEYKKVYKGFRGVDFTSAITEVDEGRSPDAVNMIGDYAGMPERRPGYIDLGYDFEGQRINGIFQYVTPDNIKYLLVHAGTKLYRLYPENESAIVQPQPPTSYIYLALVPDSQYEATVIYSSMNNTRSTSFVMGGKIYFLDGANYLVYDGTTCQSVEEVAKVPTTTIAAKPSGGGEGYDAVNLLSPYRINQFLADGTSKVYQLDTENINEVVSVKVNGTNITDYTVNTSAGTITFTTAPAKPTVTGEDNVIIKFKKVVAGYADRIKKCCINTFYGINNDIRVFVSGNPDYRNRDFYSETTDPTYFPDLNYSIVGTENTAIMGYVKQYEELVIVKQANDQDASLYLRKATTDSESNTLFTVTQGLVGIGAASRYTFCNLYDDTIFLSNEGVFGLDTSTVTLQKTAQLRSHYVNAKLSKETEKYEAVACVLNNMYYLFINNHVYIADAMQKNKNVAGSFGYEWYYWEDIPARVAREFENELYFGTADGRLCKMKSYAKYATEAYNDYYDGVKHSYLSRWSTKADPLGDASSYKRIPKANIGVLIKPADNNNFKIYYKTDKGEKVVNKDGYSSTRIFDFENIDFENIDFGADSDSPYFVAANKKDRKCKTFQMIFESDKIGSQMGLLEIHLKYLIKNRIK